MRGAHFCSMKITQDVREYAAQKEIDEQAALGVEREGGRIHHIWSGDLPEGSCILELEDVARRVE